VQASQQSANRLVCAEAKTCSANHPSIRYQELLSRLICDMRYATSMLMHFPQHPTSNIKGPAPRRCSFFPIILSFSGDRNPACLPTYVAVTARNPRSTALISSYPSDATPHPPQTCSYFTQSRLDPLLFALRSSSSSLIVDGSSSSIRTTVS